MRVAPQMSNDSCPEDTAEKSWNVRAHTVSTTTRSICCGTSMRWESEARNESMRMSFWPVSKQPSNILKLRKFRYLPVLAIITVGLSAQVSPAASELPSNQQVIAFLTESIDWYHHCVIERQIATDPVDLVFLEDNRPSGRQILQLSFDFARAAAQFSATPRPDTQNGSIAIAAGSTDLAQFVQLEDKTELQRQQASEEIEVIKKKLETADDADRLALQAALETTQSRLD